MKNKLKSKAWLLVPPLLNVLILIVTYIVKGVYPFGSSNVAYYDMTDWLVPFYARNYYIFHGSDSLLLSWLSGAGMDMTDMYPEMSLNPINWCLFFVKPDNILNFMSLFLAIKLVLASVFISLFLKKVYDLPLMVHTALCIVYTYCGYTLQYYTCTSFFDSMVLFPLIVLGMRNMFDKGSGLMYILVLFFQLVTQAYLGIMTLLFILFYSFGYMFTLRSREQRKIFAAKVGVYTFIAIALSAITSLPAVLKWTASTRVAEFGSNGIFNIFRSEISEFFNQKVFMIYNTEFATVAALIWLFRKIIKKQKQPADLAFCVYVFVLMLFPVLNESILLIWHMGSYIHFPYRNGYMFVFAAVELISCFWKHDEQIQHSDVPSLKKRLPLIFATLIAALFSLSAAVIMDSTFMEYGIHELMGSYEKNGFAFMSGAAAYLLLLIFAGRKVKEISVLCLSLAKAAVASVCFIAPLKYVDFSPSTYYAKRDRYVGDVSEIRAQAGIENDDLSRVKLLNIALANNYACVLGLPSVSQWTNRAPKTFFDEMVNLGYAHTFTRSYDCGGTVFSDAFLNNKKLIVYGDVNVPEALYTKDSQIGDYAVYDMNYTLPFGILMDDRILSLNSELEENDYLEYQKFISEAFCENGEQLIRTVPFSEAVMPEKKNNSKCEFNLHFDTDTALYCMIPFHTQVYLNGMELKLPFYDETENLTMEIEQCFLADCFHAGDDVTIVIEQIEHRDINTLKESISLAEVDLGAMEQICGRYVQNCASSYQTGDNRLHISADVNENHYMFLPLTYFEGWRAKVNGVDAVVHPVMNGAFMALELPEGHCEIEMRYMPSSLIYGAVISLAGLFAAVIVCIMKKRGKDITKVRIIGSIAYYAFTGVSACALIVVYLMPLII